MGSAATAAEFFHAAIAPDQVHSFGRCSRSGTRDIDMTTHSQDGDAGPFKPHDAAQLLAKLAAIRRDVATGMSSMAIRHRLTVQTLQLRTFIDQLGAAERLAATAQAIHAAIGARDMAAAIVACAAFERIVAGAPLSEPIVAVPASAPKPVLAPIEPLAAPVAPANDNDHDPVRVHHVPVPVQAAPVRDHSGDATCSRKEEQLMPSGLPAGFFANREPTPAWYGPFSGADELGETLRAARIRKGMSQQEVALAAGVGRRFVGELEAGKVTAEIGRVFAVCRMVGLAIVAVPL
jgi:DNA-binding XRE family transcriptional regulator